MHEQYHKKRFFEKEKTFSSNRKTIHCFFLWMIALKTHLDLIGKFKWIGKMKYIRSIHREIICENDVLVNFAKFTGKHLCQSLFFNKVAGLNFIKKILWHMCFPVNFAKFLRTPFLRNVRTPLVAASGITSWNKVWLTPILLARILHSWF